MSKLLYKRTSISNRKEVLMGWGSMFMKAVIAVVEAAKTPEGRKQIGKFTQKNWKAIVAVGTGIVTLPPKVVRWWNGKKITVVGPVAAGKTSLFCRLRGQAAPEVHASTKGIHRVEKFTFAMPLGNGDVFKLFCKRAVDVGGGVDERDRAWPVACQGADVILYIVDIEQVRQGAYRWGGRVYDDMRWLATRMSKAKRASLVHVLANKIDTLVDGVASIDDALKGVQPALDDFQREAESLFGAYRSRLTGISPISVKDDHLFSITFPKVLEAVCSAETK